MRLVRHHRYYQIHPDLGLAWSILTRWSYLHRHLMPIRDSCLRDELGNTTIDAGCFHAFYLEIAS